MVEKTDITTADEMADDLIDFLDSIQRDIFGKEPTKIEYKELIDSNEQKSLGEKTTSPLQLTSKKDGKKDEKCLNEMQEIPISSEEFLDILFHEPKEERVRLFLEACDRGMKKIQESK